LRLLPTNIVRAALKCPTSTLAEAATLAVAATEAATTTDSFSPMAQWYSVSHHPVILELPMTGGGSLTYTVVVQRKRIGWKASCINRAVPVARQQTIWGAWPIQCRATPSTHTPSAGDTNASARTDTDTSWHSLMLSDAMLQLTIFPNAINNRSLSFSLYRVCYRVLSKKNEEEEEKTL